MDAFNRVPTDEEIINITRKLKGSFEGGAFISPISDLPLNCTPLYRELRTDAELLLNKVTQLLLDVEKAVANERQRINYQVLREGVESISSSDPMIPLSKLQDILHPTKEMPDSFKSMRINLGESLDYIISSVCAGVANKMLSVCSKYMLAGQDKREIWEDFNKK